MTTDNHSSNSFVDQVKAVMAQRRSDYANPQDNHELTARLWETWWKAAASYRQARNDTSMHQPHVTPGRVPFTAEDVCILNILQKLSRLAFKTHDDSLTDVIGYCENVAMLRPDQRNNGYGEPDRCRSKFLEESLYQMFMDPNPREACWASTSG